MNTTRLRWAARQRLGARDRTHRVLRAISRQDPTWFVTAECDACIEGYPRSGNSFAVESFQQTNPTARIAHHVHVASQITRALALGIPTALVIRKPADAVSSYAIYWEGRIPIHALVRSYVDFHRSIEDRKGEYAVCPFSSFLKHPSFIAQSLNAQYGTQFTDVRDSVSDRTVLSAIEVNHAQKHGGKILRSPVPSSAKAALKAEALRAVMSDPNFEAAQTLYESLVVVAMSPT